ncbi:hypothetical protein AM493_11100 [Flavobacterium akiainvivens]|uniref:Secretion system C-terminal sorting domain-containing protein n=1 Tax=Flavobacterium akiainvivens TaxID=1202724 RepID=A0A0M8MIX7_9FLAO|nr:T9SS type A sorting domain-containing protein [Flavobacterium akiainvivens]KOS06518.1 hypothetical protein AM493_11100 [Flavobacterium akiainvivens]SFQ11555.1 Por secretion system C-terminal sorting domain-containing protein [Flavobacterium akiainvivens]
MKRTLLSVALLLSLAASAQTVNNFYPLTTPTTTYYLLTSETTLDESEAGENVNWNYTGLQPNNNESYTGVAEPTTAELDEYPGTTQVVNTSVNTEVISQFFLAGSDNGNVAVTGASASGILLNYATNNFDLGTFPKSFSTTAVTDDVAGTFSTGNYEGTFTGTGTTLVDATGTFNAIINDIEVSIPVVRLKIEQDLDLFFSGLPLGTLTQVMYSYYAETPANLPVFRTLTATVNLPAFNVNQTEQSIETYYLPVMGVEKPEAYLLAIAPNPVNNTLHIEGAEITGITVTDTMGRTVLQSNSNDTDVSNLANGVYTVSAATAYGVKTLKMVKQ